MVSTYRALEASDVLRVNVDIIRARDGKSVPIGTLEIANDITGDEHYGNYDLTLYQDCNAGRAARRGKLSGFRRAAGALALVRAALQALGH